MGALPIRATNFMECYDCKHEEDLYSGKSGHPHYGDCRTPNCKCSNLVYSCEYPRCDQRSDKQYRDEYNEEKDPFLCTEHDNLRRFIEDCVRGALRKI